MSELDKKMMNTPDLNEERLETLKRLFPDLFTIEGKLNPDELKKIIDPDLVKETERFEFKWFGKSEAKRNAFTPSKATLVYDEERSVNTEYADGNMIIEGENLETLKCLLSAYREKVKCIYIDPPYNTGNDFIYNDNYHQDKKSYWIDNGIDKNGLKLDSNLESDGRFHSNLLNFIFPRLLLSRQLLTDNGLLFVSIDDNEYHHLKKVCDEIYGQENYLGTVIWKKRYQGAKEKYLVILQEYVLVYTKNKEELEPIYIPSDPEYIKNYYTNEDDLSKIRGPYRTQPLEAGKSMGDRENLSYTITAPDGSKILPKRQWIWSEKRVNEAIVKKEIGIEKNTKGKWTVFIKQYLKDEKGNTRETKAFSIIDDIFTQHGTKEIESILGNGNIFPFPKPSTFLMRLLQLSNNLNEKAIFLDFFSGSGTTAHAVMELNKKEGSNRKFILVQIPELTDEKSVAYKAGYKKISDITIERNKRVIQKIEKEESEKQPSLLDSDSKPFKTGFKVYNLAKSNFPRVDFVPDPTKTEEENIALLNKYIDEKETLFLATVNDKNVFDEVLLKNGFMLNYSKDRVNDFTKNNVYQIKDDFKECLICMDMLIEKKTFKELESFKEKIFICLERALDTTMKWNLKHLLGDKLIAF